MRQSVQKVYIAISAILMLGAFIMGCIAYYMVTQRAVTPFYAAGIGFFVPFLIFLITLIHAARGGFTVTPFYPVAVILVVVSVVCSLALLLVISVRASTQAVTDVEQYERILALSDSRDGLMRRSFPAAVPADAEDVSFLYQPALGQGGESAVLSYQASEETIQAYEKYFDGTAVWVGRESDPQADDYGIFDGTLSGLGSDEEELSGDFMLYVMVSRPAQPDDWNHGKRNIVAIDREHLKIVFMADSW